MSSLRIHDFLETSRANGPGLRAVVWLQGCSLGCPGCFNPQTHDFQGGQRVTVEALFERIAAQQERIQGVTVSGGEPLQQMRPLTALLQRLRRETGLSILLFSGYAWEEIRGLHAAQALLAQVDVLIAGRYRAEERLAAGLLGSANKTVHLLTDRYSLADIAASPEAELLLTPEGEILASGIHPLIWG